LLEDLTMVVRLGWVWVMEWVAQLVTQSVRVWV
jgi:hypothetical protein